jgi:Transglutaminase-like superfamily
MLSVASHRAGRRVVAVLLLAAVKIALRVAPARALCALHQSCNASAASAFPPDARHIETLRQLARSIDAAARMISGTCLESALASCLGARLLGMPVRLRLGVDQLRPNLRAHAWVECGGTVLVGGVSSVVFDR